MQHQEKGFPDGPQQGIISQYVSFYYGCHLYYYFEKTRINADTLSRLPRTTAVSALFMHLL